jgi:hypothetical protein
MQHTQQKHKPQLFHTTMTTADVLPAIDTSKDCDFYVQAAINGGVEYIRVNETKFSYSLVRARRLLDTDMRYKLFVDGIRHFAKDLNEVFEIAKMKSSLQFCPTIFYREGDELFVSMAATPLDDNTVNIRKDDRLREGKSVTYLDVLHESRCKLISATTFLDILGEDEVAFAMAVVNEATRREEQGWGHKFEKTLGRNKQVYLDSLAQAGLQYSKAMANKFKTLTPCFSYEAFFSALNLSCRETYDEKYEFELNKARAIGEGHGQSYANAYARACEEARNTHKNKVPYNCARVEAIQKGLAFVDEEGIEDAVERYARSEARESYDPCDEQIFEEAKKAAKYDLKIPQYAEDYAFARSRGMNVLQAKNYANYIGNLVLKNRPQMRKPQIEFSDEQLRAIRSKFDLTAQFVGKLELLDFDDKPPTRVGINPYGIVLCWEGKRNDGFRNDFFICFDETYSTEELCRDICVEIDTEEQGEKYSPERISFRGEGYSHINDVFERLSNFFDEALEESPDMELQKQSGVKL